MNRLEKYIIKNLSVLFMSIFLSLYLIASIIFLIKIAAYTAIIQLSLLDMIKLYIFMVPELLFFTLPISFFVASALTIFRLSNDNEAVVIFALGIHPSFLFKTLLKPALLLNFLLLFNFLVVVPHVTILYKNFIFHKKSEAKFNLSASEFGHKFGNWLLYLGSENENGTYSDVILFNKDTTKETLISANTAYIINASGVLRLKLLDGESYIYSKDKFQQIDFETMLINNASDTDYISYKTTMNYWTSDERKERKRSTLITNILLSVFPSISLFLILSISIVHVRHQNSMLYLYLFLIIVVYYGSTLWLQKYFQFYTIPLVMLTWLIGTYYIYRKAIVARF